MASVRLAASGDDQRLPSHCVDPNAWSASLSELLGYCGRMTRPRDLMFDLATARGPFAVGDLMALPESSAASAAAMATALSGMPAIRQDCGALT